MTQRRTVNGSAGKALSARHRARASQARKLEAFRVQRKRVEDALTAALEDLGAAEAARLAVAAADQRLAAAVAEVRELGEKPPEIAEAMELPVSEVHRLLKLAEDAAGSRPAESQPAAMPAS